MSQEQDVEPPKLLRTAAEIKHFIKYFDSIGIPLPIIGTPADRPVFTRQNLELALEELKKIPSGGGEWEYQALDIHGQKECHSITLMSPEECKPQYDEEWKMTFMSEPDLNYLAYVHVPKKHLNLFTPPKNVFPILFYNRTWPVRDCNCQAMRYESMQEDWEGLAYQKTLVAHLEKHGEEMEQVDTILCFGLGTLDLAQTYMQHLAATTIRRVLSAKQNMRTSPDAEPKIFAQDPGYCEGCKILLKDRFNIEIVDNHQGFLQLDKSSFVITIAPSVPVSQIAVDVTFDEGGPAGMLCEEIMDESRGKATTMLIHENDPWSPRLQSYKKKCIALPMGDSCRGSEHFGSTELYLKRKSHPMVLRRKN
jgi:hypothetical protein